MLLLFGSPVPMQPSQGDSLAFKQTWLAISDLYKPVLHGILYGIFMEEAAPCYWAAQKNKSSAVASSAAYQSFTSSKPAFFAGVTRSAT